MSKIIQEVLLAENRATYRHKNTRELYDYTIMLDVSSIDYYAEDVAVCHFLGRKKFMAKSKAEDLHYQQIELQLKHKLEEIQYFHKEGMETRKWIIFSNDCISSLQVLVRGDTVMMIAGMRSSDILGLLPVDMLALVRIERRIVSWLKLKPKRVILHVHIGSAHVYLAGDREKAAKEKANETRVKGNGRQKRTTKSYTQRTKATCY